MATMIKYEFEVEYLDHDGYCSDCETSSYKIHEYFMLSPGAKIKDKRGNGRDQKET